MSSLTFGPGRTSVHSWHSPGSVVAPGKPPKPRWRWQGLPGKPMPVAGETVHVRRLFVVRSRCGLEVSPAPPGSVRSFPGHGRRAVVASEAANPSAGGCGVEDQVGRAGATEHFTTAHQRRRGIEMEITFKGRHTSVPERFRRHASVKLAKLEKLDHNAIRIDVEVSRERNPRQADHSERVELTIRSRGPAIRAEAAADDRYAALDLAFTKLEGRLRKAAERRKVRRGDASVRSADALAAVAAAPAGAAALAAEA